MPYLVKQRQTWCPVHLSAEAMNAIWILRFDQIGSILQSESARELSRVCFRRNWHLLKICTRKIHPQRCSEKKNYYLSMSWMHLTTITLWQRCRNINTYRKTTLIIQSLVKLFLLSWTCMTLYTLMMRWKDSFHNEITGFYEPICTPIKTMSSRSTVRH